jgi:hypothetical protein
MGDSAYVLTRTRAREFVDKPFAPAGKVFKEWLAVPTPDRRRWRALLNEGIAFVGR